MDDEVIVYLTEILSSRRVVCILFCQMTLEVTWPAWLILRFLSIFLSYTNRFLVFQAVSHTARGKTAIEDPKMKPLLCLCLGLLPILLQKAKVNIILWKISSKIKESEAGESKMHLTVEQLFSVRLTLRIWIPFWRLGFGKNKLSAASIFT